MNAPGKAPRRSIVIRRAYDEPGADDGYRVLVDRFWPRGRSKAALRLDQWTRELAPSAGLIRWFGHVQTRWPAFREHYRHELDTPASRDRLRALLDAAGDARITLVYGARNETENQAVVLCEVLLEMR